MLKKNKGYIAANAVKHILVSTTCNEISSTIVMKCSHCSIYVVDVFL
jgi:hypothetical protein